MLLYSFAQANSPSVFDSMLKIFSRMDTLAHPETLIDTLQAMSAVWAVIFLASGLICLFQGYKIYKTVTIISALAIGSLSRLLPRKENRRRIRRRRVSRRVDGCNLLPTDEIRRVRLWRVGRCLHWRQLLDGPKPTHR